MGTRHPSSTALSHSGAQVQGQTVIVKLCSLLRNPLHGNALQLTIAHVQHTHIYTPLFGHMDTALLQPIEAVHTPLVYSSCHITRAGALAHAQLVESQGPHTKVVSNHHHGNQ